MASLTLLALVSLSFNFLNFANGQEGYGVAKFNGNRPSKSAGRADGTCSPTTEDIEGPYYKPNAPLHVAQPGSTEPATVCPFKPSVGRLFLNGTVSLTSTPGQCGAPVRALLDVWQADTAGIYSSHLPTNNDYRCRTRFYTNDAGFYSFGTLFPGRYLCEDCPNGGYRTTHVHFKITPVDSNNNPLAPAMTTQLYFAQDMFLGEKDACPECGADEPSQIAFVDHYTDIKTFEGTWDVLLHATTTAEPPGTTAPTAAATPSGRSGIQSQMILYAMLSILLAAIPVFSTAKLV